MSKIYKYPLQITGEQVINIPNLSCVLDVQVQESEGGMPMLWAVVDSNTNHYTGVKIYIVGTGFEFSENTDGMAKFYLSTFQKEGFVWHVFYTTEFKPHGNPK